MFLWAQRKEQFLFLNEYNNDLTMMFIRFFKNPYDYSKGSRKYKYISHVLLFIKLRKKINTTNDAIGKCSLIGQCVSRLHNNKISQTQHNYVKI